MHDSGCKCDILGGLFLLSGVLANCFLYIICMYLLFKACLNFVCITCVPHLLLYSYVVAVVVEVCLPPPLLMKMRSLSHCHTNACNCL